MSSTDLNYGSKSNSSYCKNVLRVCSNTNQGMRKYMEDEVSVVIESEDKRTAFLGVFDGHGGKEASIYARDNLYANIKAQPDFSDNDPEKVKAAIREGFLKTHWDMFRVVETWPKRKEGRNSTSGTTATIAVLRENKLYIAHVGDSAAVIATKDDCDLYRSKDLTVDHKPESFDEKSRIESLGGRVASTNGVPRVVWKRAVRNVSPINGQQVATQYEYVPFLAVSRALGDLWSYDTEKGEFIVSPEPEIQAIDIIPGYHKFIVIASDGLWGVMNGEQAVDIVKSFEMSSTCKHNMRNSSQQLVNKSLTLWQRKRSRADNISAIVAFFDSELEVCAPTTLEEEADTDIVSENEDDTPPMSKENSNSSLVRQLAFHNPSDFKKCALSLNSIIDEKLDKNTDSCISNCGDNSTVNDVHSQGKRKIGDPTSESSQKKLRTTSPVVGEDSHQCNVITVLSPESLYELQLDEDLGFADDESDENQMKNRRSERTMVTRNQLLVK